MPHSHLLTRHPGTDSHAVQEIEASVSWNYGGPIEFAYALKGDLIHLRIPATGSPRKADRLWEHTCFEAFFAVKDQPAYYEVNLAPSGEWAVYAFRGYREKAPLTDGGESDADIAVQCAVDKLYLEATVRVDGLSAIQPGARVSVALSAVIEDNRGILSYWALKHPAGKPDFHHRDGFALEIEAPIPSPSPSPRGRGKG